MSGGSVAVLRAARRPGSRGRAVLRSAVGSAAVALRAHRRLLVGSLTVLIALVAWAYLPQPSAGSAEVEAARRAVQAPGFSAALGLTLAGAVGPLVAIVVSALLMDGLFRWKMLGSEFSRAGRTAVILGRLGLGWAAAAAWLASLVLGCGVAALLRAGVTGGPSGSAAAFPAGPLPLLVLAVVTGMGLWGTLAALVTLATRNGVLGIVLPLVYAIAEPQLVSASVPGPWRYAFPAWSQLASLSVMPQLPAGSSIVSPPSAAEGVNEGLALLVAVLYCVLGTALAVLRARRLEAH